MKISIIVAAFNAENYIADTVQSILIQSYNNFELIIVNDGSTDKTLEIIESIDDKRIVIISQINKGQDAAFNVGYKYSSGSFIKFMDADDLINIDMLEIQIAALKNENNKIAYGEWYRFFGNIPVASDITKPLSYWKNMQPIAFLLSDDDGPMLQCAIMLIPKSIIEKAGLWDERLILYNDTEFFSRIILASEEILFTKDAKLFYRSGLGSSLTAQSSIKFFESTFLASTLIEKNLLRFEESSRVNQFLSNLYFRRRYEMYPNYKQLAILYEAKIKQYGSPTLKILSGKVHNFLYNILGWKFVKRLHNFRSFLNHFEINNSNPLSKKSP